MRSLLKSKIIGNNMNESKAFWDRMVQDYTPSLIPVDFDDKDESLITNEVRVSLTERIDESRLLSVVIKIINNYLGQTNEYVLLDYNYKGKIVPLKVDLNLEKVHDFESLQTNVKNTLYQIEDNINYPVETILTSNNIFVTINENVSIEDMMKYKIIINFFYEKDMDEYRLRISMRSGLYSQKTVDQFINQILTENEIKKNKELAHLNFLESDSIIYEKINNVNKRNISKTIISMIMNNFVKYKSNVAVIENNKMITYEEIHDLSTKYLTYFEKNKITNKRIAISTNRSVHFIAAIIGIMRSGNSYVPVDLDSPCERNNYIITKSDASIILIDEKEVDKLKQLDTKKIMTFSEIEELDLVSEYSNLDRSSLDSSAYVIFTSGTTGNPKGVNIKHRGLANRLLWMKDYLKVNEEDIILQKTSLLFDVSVWELFLGILSGAKTVLLKQGNEGNPQKILETIELNKVTILHFVPSMLSAFLQYIDNEDKIKSFNTVRAVICSGERLSVKHSVAFYERMVNSKLYNFYGPTEATIDVTYEYITPNSKQITIGKPIDNTQVYILDNYKQLCPVGMIGELYLGGVGLASGYVNDLEKTQEAFCEYPHITTGMLYKTGDLVRLRYDGRIEYYGRNDNQVKVRGFRIEIGEIENKLTQLNGVKDAVVLNHKGKDDLIHLEAFVIKSNTSEKTESELKSELGNLLPSYMIPDNITYIDKIPVTNNGKLDSKYLLNILNRKMNNNFQEAETETEKSLKLIFEQVLDKNNIGINDNFFAMGGNSINTISIIANAKKYSLYFDFQDIFLNPTIKGLAKKIDENDTQTVDDFLEDITEFSLISTEDREKMSTDIEDAYPMSYLQLGLVYQCAIMNGGNNYHDIVSYLIRGKLDQNIFKRAVEILVIDQPIFRTSYNMKDYSENLQLVHKSIKELPLEIIDLRNMKSKEDQDEWYQKWFYEEEHSQFNFSKPGLVKFHIHILSDDQYRYSISQHNSALDGWSMNKIHTYLFQKYFELLDDNNKSIVKEISNNDHNRNFIYLEQKAVNDYSQKSFWKEYLNNIPDGKVPKTKLPNQVELENDQVVFQDILLPENLSQKLIELAEKEKVPVKDLLLTSHMKFLGLITGSSDILSGYEIGGRPEIIGSEDALGLFLNTMPFRVELNSSYSWKEVIQKVYEVDCKCLPYRRYPMAKVKQDLKIREILFEPVFNYTHFYALKELKKFDELDLMNVKAGAVTEFPLRTEFSRHHFTDEIQLSLHYHTAYYDKEDILLFGDIFKDILISMVKDTDTPHTSILLPNQLKERLINISTKENIDQTGIKNTSQRLGNSNNEEQQLKNTITNLKSVWSQILDYGQEISMLDDFFDIGGDSIKALQLSSKFAGTLAVTDILTNSRLVDMAMVMINAKNNYNSSSVKENIYSIWATLLEIDTDILTDDMDFFDIGGDSIKALRLSQELELDLIDILTNSTLEKQIALLMNKSTEIKSNIIMPNDFKNDYLNCIYEGNSKQAIIFFPYAAGTPLNYRSIAKELHKGNSEFSIYVVSYPGHEFMEMNNDLRSMNSFVREISREIEDKISVEDIFFWGHCVGSSFALAVAEQLQKNGKKVREVIIAGKLFRNVNEINQILNNVDSISFNDIKELFQSGKNSTNIEALSPIQRDNLLQAFKHDSKEANNYLKEQLEKNSSLSDINATLVFAKDDTETINFEKSIEDWSNFIKVTNTFTLEEGGHYFIETKPKECSEIIEKIIRRAIGG